MKAVELAFECDSILDRNHNKSRDDLGTANGRYL